MAGRHRRLGEVLVKLGSLNEGYFRSRVRVVLATDSAMQRALTRFHARAPTPATAPTPVRQLVRQVASSNGLSSREVFQRVFETWAENTLSRNAAQ